MVSKVVLLTAAVAVCSFMVVVYMAVVPSYQYRSVWNIENKHIYNVHLMDSAQGGRGVAQVELGRDAHKVTTSGTGSTQTRDEMSYEKERQDFEPVNPGSNKDGKPFQAVTGDRKQRTKTAEIEGDILSVAPHVQVERTPDTAVSRKQDIQIPNNFSSFQSTTVNRTAVTTNAEMPWPKCSNRMCSEYLSSADKAAFQLCINKVKSNLKHATPQNGSCHFMDGSHRQPVALVSLPGSGNTWVRGLLETATNICTGFVFCDISLRVQGFIGENIQSGSVLAVKTHGSVPLWAGPGGSSKRKTHFGSAIFIVRNPLDAHVAEWNRKVANNFRGMTVTLQSHVKRAGKEWFGQNKRWQNFVHDQTRRWQTMIKNWIVINRHHPVLVVMYEDLKQNALHEVLRMLEFLKVPHSMDIVEQRLAAGFNSFQRSHHKDDFEHYTHEQQDFVKEAVISTSKLLEDNHLTHILQLQNYVTAPIN